MNVEIFTICDAATSDSGKLNVLGSFDTIWAEDVPIAHPQAAVALKVRFDSAEQGDHDFVLNITGPDGKEKPFEVDGKLNIKPESKEAKTVAANMILNFGNLELKKLGEYSVNILIDGEKIDSIPFFVRKQKS